LSRAEFISKWRESHKEGWHDQECCVNELLDELEGLFASEMKDATSPKPEASQLECELCKKDGTNTRADFIIRDGRVFNRAALCYAHWKELR